jgi:hypothetical protein
MIPKLYDPRIIVQEFTLEVTSALLRSSYLNFLEQFFYNLQSKEGSKHILIVQSVEMWLAVARG